MEEIRHVIEWVALALELLAVFVVAVSVVAALVYPTFVGAGGDLFTRYKHRLGRGLLLGLELLLAADIVGTVGLPLTLETLAPLGLLAVIRSFLSWSLEVEIEGCWPWRARDRTERRDEASPSG